MTCKQNRLFSKPPISTKNTTPTIPIAVVDCVVVVGVCHAYWIDGTILPASLVLPLYDSLCLLASN